MAVLDDPGADRVDAGAALGPGNTRSLDHHERGLLGKAVGVARVKRRGLHTGQVEQRICGG
jgi:hypothetical protein